MRYNRLDLGIEVRLVNDMVNSYSMSLNVVGRAGIMRAPGRTK